MKTILVPLDLSDYTAAATERACQFAQATGASLLGLTTLDTEGIARDQELPFHAEYRIYPNTQQIAMTKDAAEKLEMARERFTETCAKAGVTSSTVERRGIPAMAILDEGRFCDLVAMGLKSHFHFETQDKPGDTLEKVIDGSLVPVLSVEAFDDQPLERALIAFDGSPSATRALHAFAHLWHVSKPEVKLITSAFDKENGQHLLDHAQRFLQSWGVTPITTELVKESIIDVVDRDYMEWADWFVVGVRSGGPLKHLFVGSFARHLMHAARHTVLFSQ